MLQLPGVIPEAEEERANHRPRPVLVPAEARDDAVRGAQVLDLGHLPLAGAVLQLGALCDHSVESRPLEDLEPVTGHGRIARRGREQDRFRGVREEQLEPGAPLVERSLAEVIGPLGQAVEGDVGRRRLGRQHLHARCRRMNAEEQGLELEPSVAGDHDLAVQHEAGGGTAERAKGSEELREVSVQRLQVPRL